MTADGVEIANIAIKQNDGRLDLLAILNRCLNSIGIMVRNMDVGENQNPMVAFDDERFALLIRGFWEKILLPAKRLGSLSRSDTLSMPISIRAS